MKFGVAALIVAVLATATNTLVSSHDCDNYEELPTAGGLVSLFGMDYLEDGSYCVPVWDSDVPIIADPHYDDSEMSYTTASSSNLFVLTNEDNPYHWCWDACEHYESDSEEEIHNAFGDDYYYNYKYGYGYGEGTAVGGSEDEYEYCWAECQTNFTFYYGLSYFHRLQHDETWHFYFGDTLYLYELDNNAAGDMRVTKLGADILNGEVYQYTVKAGTWFGAQVNPKSESENIPYSFGATMYSPLYEEGNYELAEMNDNYTIFDVVYTNAKDKIVELSYFPDYVKPADADDAFAEEGEHSLCRSDHNHGEEEDYDYDFLTLDEIVDHYDMEEAPHKTGYYTIDYESEETVLTNYGGLKPSQSSMYYAMNDTVFFHKQQSDETYHFYRGEPIILYHIDDTASPRILRAVPIGNDLAIGEIPHYTVPKDTWIAYEFKNNNFTYWNNTNSTPYALMGLTNAPAYHLEDMEYGTPEAMIENFPEFESTISSLYATGSAQGSGEVVYIEVPGLPDDEGIGALDTDSSISALQSSQNAANEGKSISTGGKVFLFMVATLALLAIIALFVKVGPLHRNNKKVSSRSTQVSQVLVMCERDGKIEDTEVVSVA